MFIHFEITHVTVDYIIKMDRCLFELTCIVQAGPQACCFGGKQTPSYTEGISLYLYQ